MSFLRFFNIPLQRIRLWAAFFIFSFPVILPGPKIHAQTNGTIRKIVIDPGHGGNDPGAMGKRSREKNLNLAIALKLGNMIQRNFKEVKVIYTRDRDYFVELDRRSEIANSSKADLFISIHCNANRDKSLRGAETYVMGLHKSQANLEIAKQENSAILLESDYSARYSGFDPNNDESYITFSLFQNSNLEQSMEFAAEIQQQLEERVGLNNRGVRQAGFIVLYKTTMPSVLVESGYLSNASEENFLITDKGQEYIASAIFRAFKVYKQKLENPGAAPEYKIPEQKKETIQIVPYQEAVPRAGTLSFRVQIATTSTDIGTDSPKFDGFAHVSMYRHNGLCKYTVGDEPSLEAANRLLQQVKRKGFKDAFIVIFRGNERIPESEAKRILGK
ncbi:MAG: N-acetylmuramoyl-L-alanine amidase [bacterium]